MQTLIVTPTNSRDRERFSNLLSLNGWRFTQLGEGANTHFEIPGTFDGPLDDDQTPEEAMRAHLDTNKIKANVWVRFEDITADLKEPDADAVFVDVATKLLEAMQTNADPVAFLKAELDARKQGVRGSDYMEQLKRTRELAASIVVKVEKFAIIHQNTGTWYDDINSINGRLSEIDNTFFV